MKVKTISRSESVWGRDTKNEQFRLPRNMKEELHPLAKAREYTRAVVAAKMDRMMAHPFLGAMSGHADGVYCTAMYALDRLCSGSADGEVKLWCLSEKKCLATFQAHEGACKGVCEVPQSQKVFSCGLDKTVKLWGQKEEYKYSSTHGLNTIAHNYQQEMFATGGESVEIWNHNRSNPTFSYNWDSRSITQVKFNKTETNVLASVGTDRSIILYDVRMQTALKKVVMINSCNSVCWNPMEPFIFAVGNEDHNVYLFDMRFLESSTNVFRDHVSAVLDIDFSPTGREIVSGAFDRTIRIFNVSHGHSRDVYFLKRMQRIWSVKFSLDSKYITAGSDDGNIRLWKSKASEKLGLISQKEKQHLEMSEALVSKYKHMPEIRKIVSQRHLPSSLKKQSTRKKIKVDAYKLRKEKEIEHCKLNVERVPERKKGILNVLI